MKSRERKLTKSSEFLGPSNVMKLLRTTQLPKQLFFAEQVREHEESAAEQAGVSMWQLMDRAGHAIYECLETHFPLPIKVVVLCGSGNNGGDGYVAALAAQRAGYKVEVYAAKPPKSDDASRAYNNWLQAGNSVQKLNDWFESRPDVVIDAMLGTGISSGVKGEYREVIEALNERKLPIIAADIPSGIHANTGVPLGVAVKARYTVAMVALKVGLLGGGAKDFCGDIYLADLGIYKEFSAQVGSQVQLLTGEQVFTWLEPRRHATHKGSYGHVVVIGGAEGMAGAAGMAGLAALRSGAGKVSIICAPRQSKLAAISPELMVREGGAEQPELQELVKAANVIAIGPGLGKSQWAKDWLSLVLSLQSSTIVDADALNLLSGQPVTKVNWVLTPHPAEAARLLSCPTADVQNDRFQAAHDLHNKYGATVILKGAGTVIRSVRNCAICAHGTPALATAGTGDILTGITAGIWAQSETLNLKQHEVAELAVLIHALAGEKAAQTQFGECTRGIIATDLLPEIIGIVNPKG